MTWNGTIRCVTLSYIKTCISVGNQVRLILDGYEFQGNQEKFFALVMGAYVVAVPYFAYLKLKKMRETLTFEDVRAKYLSMYDGIHLYREKTNIFYFPITIARRLVFVMLPSVFYNFPFIQLQLLLFGTSMYAMFYTSKRPFKDGTRVKLEIFNEIIFMVGCYHMLTFSKFNLKAETAFMMGYSFITCTATMIGVNLGYIAWITFSKWRRRMNILKNKRAAKQHLEAVSGSLLKSILKKSGKAGTDGEFTSVVAASVAIAAAESDSSLNSSSGANSSDSEELPAYEPVKDFNKGGLSAKKKVTGRSRTMRFNLSNLNKMPMDVINEEESENNQTMIDLDLPVGMAKLPAKGKAKRNNAVMHA